jgi:hypothetical protein
MIFQQRNLIENFPTGIFGIVNGSEIPLPMGVPEIGTENRNSQPSTAICAASMANAHAALNRHSLLDSLEKRAAKEGLAMVAMAAAAVIG